MAAGLGGLGELDGSFQINWDNTNSLRNAYAITYRYDRPEPIEFSINNASLSWEYDSQVGEEFLDGTFTNYFAVHVQEITDLIEIDSGVITVNMNGNKISADHPNQGWWSIMCVFIYENASINQKSCIDMYTASQPQNSPQEYFITTPSYSTLSDIGFSIYAERIGQTSLDNSIVGINGSLLGEIGHWSGNELGSVQGHFYYENGSLTGVSDNTADNIISGSDGLALINEYIVEEPNQEIYISPLNFPPTGPANPHPAFFLSYTPDCNFLPDLSDMPRTYSLCRGESIELQAAVGYDNYSWSTSLGNSDGLSDSILANPICSADTSLWYTVRMWNDEEEGCSQTIPVFVEVNTVPVPQNIEITPSVCPPATGGIEVINPAGPGSFTYSIDGVVQLSPVFDELAAGSYDIAVNSAQGCVWDSTITVPLNPTQEADFTPNPSSGFSPLEVFFDNQSTGASDYLWLIDGEEISSSENLLYNFPDSGSFEISLIAFLNEESCADTATFTLRVDQGIEVMLPNIITPNGDGRNDKLVAMLKGVDTCQWVVYNRWGVELHAGASPKLSGLSNLQTVNDSGFRELQLWEPEAVIPDGVYTVVFQAQGIKGQSEEMVFSLTMGR